MQAEEFDNASEDALLGLANHRLSLLEKVGSLDTPALLLEAQMYLTAVSKKRDERVAALLYAYATWLVLRNCNYGPNSA